MLPQQRRHRRRGGAWRRAGAVAILDVDYHHGNGTQDIFYARGDVLFVSIHADPGMDYPYFWGHADETGEGEGEGATLNLPLPRGTDLAAYLPALDAALARIAAFAPDLLVVSYGADTFAGDPISLLPLRDSGLCRARRGGSPRSACPTLVVMEGGYAVDALGANVAAFLVRLLELLGQLRDDLEQVADQADVGDLEDRRVLVLVDRDDDLRILHAGEVLDRARNADRDIDFGGDDLAGLADLIVVGRIAGVDRGAAGADARLELVGERIEQRMELLRRAEGAAARDDDLGAGQLGPLGLGELGADEGRRGPCRRSPATGLDRRRSRLPRAAFSKAVPRTVITFLASDDFTVAIALPA